MESLNTPRVYDDLNTRRSSNSSNNAILIISAVIIALLLVILFVWKPFKKDESNDNSSKKEQETTETTDQETSEVDEITEEDSDEEEGDKEENSEPETTIGSFDDCNYNFDSNSLLEFEKDSFKTYLSSSDVTARVVTKSASSGDKAGEILMTCSENFEGEVTDIPAGIISHVGSLKYETVTKGLKMGDVTVRRMKFTFKPGTASETIEDLYMGVSDDVAYVVRLTVGSNMSSADENAIDDVFDSLAVAK